MLELVFTVILAGCGDGSADCTVLSRTPVVAESREACERVLDARLMQMGTDYPEYAGVCQAEDLTASLPEGWTEREWTLAQNVQTRDM